MTLREYFRKDNPFDYIALGFIVRLIGDCFALFVNKHISGALFGCIAWLLIIKGFAKIPKKHILPFSKGYAFLFLFYCMLYVVLVIRGYTIDYRFPWWTTMGAINMHLFASHYWLWVLMPLTVLIPTKYYNFRLFLLYSSLFAFVTLVVAIIFRNDIIQSTIIGAAGIKDQDMFDVDAIGFYSVFAFIPLLYRYIPHKTWLINIGGLVVCLLLMMLGARRGGTLLLGIMLMSSIFFYTSSKPVKVRHVIRILMFLLAALSVYFVLNSFISEYLLERGLEDSRTGVEEAMLNQMSNTELIFGKGLNGRYYYPLFVDDELDGWRYGIETGFYNLVLKGGYLLAFSHILLMLIPACKGLFNSRNLFCKAGGFFILYNLFSLWPFGHLLFNINFLIVWMMVVCCMNKNIRRMNDEEIKNAFFYNIK